LVNTNIGIIRPPRLVRPALDFYFLFLWLKGKHRIQVLCPINVLFLAKLFSLRGIIQDMGKVNCMKMEDMICPLDRIFACIGSFIYDVSAT
jgi:hypothetical protein